MPAELVPGSPGSGHPGAFGPGYWLDLLDSGSRAARPE